MAVNSINGSSTLRLMGMSSGLDTDSVIKQMMNISRIRLDTRFRSRTMLEWKQEALGNVSNMLTDFRWKYLTVMGPDAMRLSSAYNSTTAAVTGKNAGAVSIATSINSQLGTVKIGKIDSLAKATSVTSASTVSRNGQGFKLTDKLSTLMLSNRPVNFDSNNEALVNINGADITLSGNETIDSLNSKLSAAGANQIIFQPSSYHGENRQFAASVMINGKKTYLFKDEAYNTLGNIYGRKDIASQLIFGGATDKPFDLNGAGAFTLYSDGKFEDILSDPDGAKALIFGSGTAKTIKVNGVDINITDLSTLTDLVDAHNNSMPPPASQITFNGAGEASININGKTVTIYASDGGTDLLNIRKVTDAVIFGGSDQATFTLNNREITVHYSERNSEFISNPKFVDALVFGGTGTISASISGNVVGGTITALNRYDTLDDLIVFDASPNPHAQITIGGVPFDLYKNDEWNLGALIHKSDYYNSSFATTLASRANATDGGFTFTNNAYGDDAKATLTFTIAINGTSKAFTLNKNSTIEDMLNAVNTSNLGVTMKYDRLNDRFSIEAKNTGASSLYVGGLQALGIYNGTYKNGSVARAYVNGEWIESATNTIDYRGIKITLNETNPLGSTTLNGGYNDNDITVLLKRDATESMSKIKNFVEGYNTIIKKLEDLLKERKTDKERAYAPLTDAEKESMTEKQIADWEAIAKKGLLRNDHGIQSMLTSLRGALYASVKSAGLSPSAIGLQTGTYISGMGGQIVVDENILRQALENDPEKVMNVFMGGTDSTSFEERGLLWRMDDIMRGYMNGSQYITLNSLVSSIRRENEQIEKLQDKMYKEEERLYAKFAALETALSKLQQQGDWFTQMLGNNNK